MNITRLVVRHVSERRISSARSTATPTPRQYPLGTCKDLRCERRLLRLDLGALQRPRLPDRLSRGIREACSTVTNAGYQASDDRHIT
jgi:hypothetical protein